MYRRFISSLDLNRLSTILTNPAYFSNIPFSLVLFFFMTQRLKEQVGIHTYSFISIHRNIFSTIFLFGLRNRLIQ